MNKYPKTISAKNKKSRELFLAIYFNDLDKVIEIKNRYPGIYERKNHFKVILYHHQASEIFDLRYLTKFNKILWFDDQWREDLTPWVEKNRKRTQQMIDFWIKEGEADFLDKTFPYNKYHEFFQCDDPNDPEIENEILFEPISDYINKGFREIDLRLYNRVECFDFEKVSKLLKQGANPSLKIEEDDPVSDIFSWVEVELSFLETVEVIPLFRLFEQKGYELDVDIGEIFGNFLGLAAYTEMYQLLLPYTDE